ncbi:hypothetical protein [Bradyrhizobium sp.]|uniref:hypothetical protein n=1 Tax=Bradyrhizobium sp. TaxID=376 RepID=UPI0025C672AB|nr:hypothetical protein [Bradyrhizobium sp.]
MSQVISPFAILRSQISGIRKPQVMASTNGGQRLSVSSLRELIALNACVGIALGQAGKPNVAGIGGGNLPSSSAGQRKLRVISLSDIRVRLIFTHSTAAPVGNRTWHAVGVERRSARACEIESIRTILNL